MNESTCKNFYPHIWRFRRFLQIFCKKILDSNFANKTIIKQTNTFKKKQTTYNIEIEEDIYLEMPYKEKIAIPAFGYIKFSPRKLREKCP